MVNGRRGTAHPFCVAGAALREPGRCLWSTVAAGPRTVFVWQVQHLESLDAACGQRSPRDRAPFCVAGAALREPGRCLWSTVAAAPRTFLPGRCSTRCTGCCFCVAGATHLARLISLHSSHTTHLTELTHLMSHNSTHRTHLTQTSLTQTHLTQLISHNSFHTTYLTQFNSLNSSHTT